MKNITQAVLNLGLARAGASGKNHRNLTFLGSDVVSFFWQSLARLIGVCTARVLWLRDLIGSRGLFCFKP